MVLFKSKFYSGLIITARNYLEIFIYDRWSDHTLPYFRSGDTFTPTKVEIVQSSTSAPSLLTEHELIALMDTHKIGTDGIFFDFVVIIIISYNRFAYNYYSGQKIRS